MKKLLAAVMAGAIVASMASVASFAAEATKGTAVFDLTGAVATAAAATFKYDNETFTSVALTAGADVDVVGAALADTSTASFEASYNAANNRLTITAKAAKALPMPRTGTLGATTVTVGSIATISATDGTDASSFDAVSVVTGGPFVEAKDDMSGADTVKTSKTLYFTMDQDIADHPDMKLTVKKGEGSKNIASVDIVQKTFANLYAVASNGTPGYINTPMGGNHDYYVAVELKELMTDAEFKVAFDVKATAKKATTINGVSFAEDDVYASDDVGTTWVTNKLQTGDIAWAAGTQGFIAKPLKNDDNEVEWEDNNRTIAKLAFTADSDVSKYYPKLSTKWDNAIYAENFEEGEAFKFEFVGEPTISSSSRAELTIFNPFINSDDEITVPVEELTVYQLIDGEFVDVTAQFKAGTNDDGDEVLTLKTRTLGTYMVCDEAAVNSGVSGNPTTDVPVKDVPNTGR